MLVIKLYREEEDIRRISFQETPTFQQLKQRICQVYNVQNVSLKYLDEEDDCITVADDSDLREALISLDKNRPLLKLIIIFPGETTTAVVNQKLLQSIIAPPSINSFYGGPPPIQREQFQNPNLSQYQPVPQKLEQVFGNPPSFNLPQGNAHPQPNNGYQYYRAN